MSDAYSGLLSLGASEAEIERLVMRNPRALTVNAARIRAGGHFLKQYCGFSKVEKCLYDPVCVASIYWLQLLGGDHSFHDEVSRGAQRRAVGAAAEGQVSLQVLGLLQLHS